MKKNIISFGNWRYYKTLEKLKNSALERGNIDNIFLLKESDIEPYFYEKNIKLFNENRGFGYWSWKPYFIKQFLARCNDDDYFLYIDSGNLILNDLTPLFKILEKNKKGIVLFNNCDGSPDGSNWKNINWTKADCFNLLGLTSEKYTYGNQVNGSFILFKKTDFSIKFFNTFLQAATNYHIISDYQNITENFNKNEFRDHRHDQSVLSLLSIHYDIQIIRDPSQWGNHLDENKEDYSQLIEHHRRKFYI